MIRDPVDNVLPEDTGQITLEDPFSRSKLLIDPNMMYKTYNLRSKEIKDKIKKEFLMAGCDTLELITNKPFEKEISNFFVRARRKWR